MSAEAPQCGCWLDEYGKRVDSGACLYSAVVMVNERQQRDLNEAKRIILALVLKSAWTSETAFVEAADWIARRS